MREVDPLFLGMTRPAMFLGVPIGAVMCNVVFSGGIGFLIGLSLLGTPWLMGVFPVIHVIMMMISKKDPHKLNVMGTWLFRCLRAGNRSYHKGSSYKG